MATIALVHRTRTVSISLGMCANKLTTRCCLIGSYWQRCYHRIYPSWSNSCATIAPSARDWGPQNEHHRPWTAAAG